MVGRLIRIASDRYQLNQNSEINVTPFVDVMMVLLIIFMLSLPAATVSLKLDLPPASNKGRAVQPTYVSLGPDGALFIGDKATSLARLSADLAGVVGGANPRAQRIYVRADRGVRYGAFLQVVDTLHASGFHAVGLVNEETPASAM
jgi:biopolymer transport protein ExbD